MKLFLVKSVRSYFFETLYTSFENGKKPGFFLIFLLFLDS